MAVIGVGGVGLNGVQGRARGVRGDSRARHAPLSRSPRARVRRDRRRRASGEKVTEAGEGTARRARRDYVFDTVGSPATLAQALQLARKGGTVVLTGSRASTHSPRPAHPLVMQEKRLVGSLYGSGQPARGRTATRRTLPRRKTQTRRTRHAHVQTGRGERRARFARRARERAASSAGDSAGCGRRNYRAWTGWSGFEILTPYPVHPCYSLTKASAARRLCR